MRHLPFLLLLAACAPEAELSGPDAALREGDVKTDPAAELDPELEVTCLDDDCLELWLTLDPWPKGPVTWVLDGEKLGEADGMTVEVWEKPRTFEVITDRGTHGGTIVGNLGAADPYTVIQTAFDCDRFRILTVGGCITGGPTVDFEGPALFNPHDPNLASGSVRFDLLPPDASLVDLGFAYAAWWPEAGGQQRAVRSPPPGMQLPWTTTSPTGTTSFLEVRHAVARGVAAPMWVTHAGGGPLGMFELSAAVCSEDGRAALVPGGVW